MHAMLSILVEAQLVPLAQAYELDALSEADALTHPMETWAEAGLDDVRAAACFAEALDLPHLDLARIERPARDLLGMRFIEDHLCLPIQVVEPGQLIVAMVDPTRTATHDEIRRRTEREPVPRVISLTAFRRIAAANYEHLRVLGSPRERVFKQVFSEAVTGGVDEFEVRDGILSAGLGIVFGDRPEVGATLIRYLRVQTRVPPELAAIGGIGVHVYGYDPVLWFVEFAEDDQNARLWRVTEEQWYERFDELPAPVDW